MIYLAVYIHKCVLILLNQLPQLAVPFYKNWWIFGYFRSLCLRFVYIVIVTMQLSNTIKHCQTFYTIAVTKWLRFYYSNEWSVGLNCDVLLCLDVYYYIQTEKKLLPFCKRHFKMFFLEWKCMNFAKVPTNNVPAPVQIMAWRRTGDKPLSESMMVSFLMHICVAWPQWVEASVYIYIYSL